MGDITNLIKNMHKAQFSQDIREAVLRCGSQIEKEAIADHNTKLISDLYEVTGVLSEPGYELLEVYAADQMHKLKKKQVPSQPIHKSEMAKIIGTSEHNVDKCMWKSRGIELCSDFCFKKSDIPILKGYLKKYKLN